jgi:hypothetical protein
VGSSVDALGGAGKLLNAGPIHADAVVTFYDDDGTAYVNEHHQVYNLRAGTLRAHAELPDGPWTARIAAGGAGSLDARVAMSPQRRGLLLSALRTCQHRVRGPLNLFNVCATGETAGKPRRVHLPGMELFRVGVSGGDEATRAYYFDAQTYLLRLVTVGADTPGADGTVTLYTYRVSGSGEAFPSRLAVMKIGKHVLVGDTPVLEVDFQRVRF